MRLGGFRGHLDCYQRLHSILFGLEFCGFVSGWGEIGGGGKMLQPPLYFSGWRGNLDFKHRATVRDHRVFCGWGEIGGGRWRRHLHAARIAIAGFDHFPLGGRDDDLLDRTLGQFRSATELRFEDNELDRSDTGAYVRFLYFAV